MFAAHGSALRHGKDVVIFEKFKTACTFINNEILIANPRWIDLELFKDYNILPVPESEPWAANTIQIGDTVCLEAGATETAELVSKAHERIELIDTSEFRKAEGSLTCLR